MDNSQVDLSVLKFNNYNEYLTSFIRIADMRYLKTRKMQKTIIKLGYCSEYIPYNEEEFIRRKDIALKVIAPKIMARIKYSDFIVNKNDAFLMALKAREEANISKILSTIIFLVYKQKDGSEISGYIDFEESTRLSDRNVKESIDWRKIFEGTKRLKPDIYNLSYVNTKTKDVYYNNSDNFLVVHDHANGLTFLHKGDHKKISVGPKLGIHSGNFKREMVYSKYYGFVVLYDHVIRKKN